MSAYVRSLIARTEAGRARQEAAREEKARAEAKAAREKLVPLDVRLSRLLATFPPEVQTEGLSLETIRRMLRGVNGRGAHAGELGEALRRNGLVRRRGWVNAEGGFRALWYLKN